MSKQVDERVVSMQFDNRHFESNVQTTMSTLDKLKHALRLDGASKGLEGVNSAAGKVNMSGLASGVETVTAKFSALQVMGVTALANITNQAVNAGKRMAAALTIDPIKTGFQEYETQMNAVQTILANTQSKGSTLDDVNKALDTLNTYADKTIYNFTEMTRNIGTFTAAGVDLQTSVDSIQGIANLAAVSGSSSQQASTAMYQLSQALAAGRVSLMDWNSVVNAGMGGELFQNALIRTSELLKTGAKESINMYGSFRESLTKGQWLTTEVLTETLKQISGAYTEADLISQGFTKAQAKEIIELSKTATDAATKVKTFSQLWDVMKESAQSGWAQTWKIIVGDFEEAKALLTPLADFFTGIIGRISDARNRLLEGALGNPFEALFSKLSSVNKMIDATSKLTGSLEYYQKVVTKVWRGDYNNRGDNPDRYDLLKKEGYNARVVQELVNKGYKYKLTMEDVAAAQKKYGASTSDAAKSTSDMTGALENLTDEQLKNAGFTEEEIKLFRELEREAKKAGMSISDYIKSMEGLDGRTMLIESFKNAGKGLVAIFTAMKDAWVEVFPPMTSLQLYNLIRGLYDFSQHLKVSKDAADKFKRTFKGVFALIDIIGTLVAGPLKIAFKIFKQILSMFHLDLLDVTAAVGDAIVGFNEWLDKTLDFTEVFEVIAPYIEKAAKAIGDWVDSVKPLEKIGKFFSESAEGIRAWIKGFKDADNIPQYIIEGLVNGLRYGVTSIFNAVIEIGKGILDAIKGILGIHSPSTEMEEVGRWTIEGFVQGIQNGASSAWEAIRNFGAKCIEVIKSIDFGAIFAAGISAGMIVIGYKLADAFGKLMSPFEGLGDMLSGAGEFLEDLGKGLKKNFKAKALERQSRALLNMAFAIGILAASVYVLCQLDVGSMWIAIGAIAALMVLLGGLIAVVGKFGPKDTVEMGKFAVILLGISGSLFIIALALKQIAGLDDSSLLKGGLVILALSMIVSGLIAATKLFGGSADKVGSTLLKMSAAILIMTFVVKQLSKLETGALIKGTVAIALFGGILIGLMAATKLAGPGIDKAGSTLLKMSAALLIMVFVVKLISRMETGDIAKGLAVIVAFGAIITGLIAATRLVGGNTGKIGSTILGISAAMLLMAMVVRIVSGLETGALVKGIVVIAMFGGIITGLIAATKLAGKNLGRVGFTILMLATAIGILATVAAVLGFMKVEHLAKGLIAVRLLGGVMAMMIRATKGASDCMKNLVVLTVAIGIMTGAIVALSFIDSDKVAVSTAALGSVMGMFALLMYTTKYLTTGEGTWKQSLISIGVLTLVVAALAGIIALLSMCDPSSVLHVTAALSLLLLSLSGTMLLMSKINGKSASGAMKGILALTAMVVPLAVFCLALHLLPDVSGAAGNINLLIPVLAAMALLIIPLTLIGLAGWAPFIGILALTAMVVPLVAFCLALHLLPDVTGATANVQLLLPLMAAMTALLIPLTLIGILGLAALAGITALTLMVVPLAAFGIALHLLPDVSGATANVELLTGLLDTLADILIKIAPMGPLALIGTAALYAMVPLMVAFGVLATEVGALVTWFPDLQVFLDTGIPIMEQLAHGLGSVMGSFITGFAGEVMTILPMLGTCLSQFMINATPFIEGIKMVDETVLAGVGILAGAIAALTVASLLESIVSFMSGGQSFSALGTELSTFMMNAMPFVAGAKSIDPTVLEGIKMLAEALLTLTGASLLEQIGSWISGESSLATFGAQLGTLGTNLNQFVTNLGTFTEEQVTTVNCAGKAIKALADAAKACPGTGGLWQGIVGESGLSSLSGELPSLGSNLSTFITNLGTFDESQLNTVKIAGEAIVALADAAKSCPATGGLWQLIVGESGLASLSGELPKLGTNLASFITNLGTFNEEQLNTVKIAGDAIVALSKAAEACPATGGLWQGIVGESGLAALSGELPTLGTNLNSFITNLGTFGEDKVATVNAATKVITSLGNVAKSGSNFGNLKTFGENIVSVAKKIVEFSKKMSEVTADSITSAKTKIDDLISLAKTIASTNVKSLNTFGDSFKKVATDGVNGFVKEFTGEAPKTKVTNAAKGLIDAFIKAAEGKKKDVNDKFKSIAEGAADKVGAKSIKDDFTAAGKDLVTGFANGIKNNKKLATDAGSALGKAALAAAKAALDENSPSKEMYKVGDFAGIGFVNALYDNVSDAYKAGSRMADSVKNGLSGAISRVYDAINSDIDAQPTIRPVLDLSDIQSGASAIGGMLSGRRTLLVDARAAGSISASMMNYQNGRNSNDVVSAIKGLRKDIADMPRNTYSIGGITYDDGSNISEAVQTLVRAARVERRS